MNQEINIEEITYDLWNLIGGDRWGEHEMTAKFAWDQPRMKNGAPRMLDSRILKHGLRRFVKARPQAATDYLKQTKPKVNRIKNPKTYKELISDPRVDEVFKEDMGREGTDWFVYLAKGYIASDETTTIRGKRPEVLSKMREVIQGEPV